MKTFKKILRILALLHIFPLAFIWQSYLTGWVINLIMMSILLILFFFFWLFEDDYQDYDPY